MKTCILADRLYVPEKYVTENALKKFTYFLTENDKHDYSSVEGYSVTYRNYRGRVMQHEQINTYIKVELDGEIYYGFCRGDLPKLFDLFGDHEWEDRTAKPAFRHPLDFRTDRSLLTFDKDGRGQTEAVSDWLDMRYGILRAPPRFGKTIAAIFIACMLQRKTLIIAHQIELLRQFYKSVLEFTNVEDLWASYGIQRVRRPSFIKGQEVTKYRLPRNAKNVVVGFFNEHYNPEELDICLLPWQKFGSKFGPERIQKYQNTWGLVIVDEVHRASSLKFAHVVSKINASYRLGLTGTVERKDGLDFIAREIIGPVTADGQVKQVPCKVQVFLTGYMIKTRMVEPLPTILKKFYTYEDRIERILKMLVKDAEAGYYICVAFHPSSKDQLQEFTENLNLLLVSKKAEAFWGGSLGRDDLFRRVVDGETHVLVCNAQMLTGIDVPRWNMFYNIFPESNVVFNKEGKLSGNFYQKFSRIRTVFTYEDGTIKSYGIIKDFLDDGTFARGTFKHRLDAYKNQGFPVEFFNWKKKGM
jgi:hypothetical protein